MKRYIDADKLIAEIERRMESHRRHSADGYIIDPNRLDEDEDILSFITSLQQEHPEVELKPIWHNVVEETPTEIGAEVIVACKNKNKECGIWLYDLIQCWEGEWKPRVNWETPIRWAYVRDLDNERKEK